MLKEIIESLMEASTITRGNLDWDQVRDNVRIELDGKLGYGLLADDFLEIGFVSSSKSPDILFDVRFDSNKGPQIKDAEFIIYNEVTGGKEKIKVDLEKYKIYPIVFQETSRHNKIIDVVYSNVDLKKLSKDDYFKENFVIDGKVVRPVKFGKTTKFINFLKDNGYELTEVELIENLKPFLKEVLDKS